jgi:CheY-like chemotaxis protein
VKVLIIDDSATVRAMLRDLFEEEGLEVLEAATGAEGMEKVFSERPDIALVDNILPDTDGLEVCRRIRMSVGADVRVVFMTGSMEKIDYAAAKVSGADAWAAKTPDFGPILSAALDKGA